jgi:hypothetical protein
MKEGEDGTGITREIDVANKKVAFKKISGGTWKNAFGKLGYLSQDKITKVKVTFKKGINNGAGLGFGIARDELDISDFDRIRR